MALKVVVNTDLNIRSGSGTENDIIGSAPSGCSYDVSGVKKDGGGTTWKYRDWETDRKSTPLNSSHSAKSRMPSSA